MDNNENGKWITVKGRHVFIKDGQSVEDAIDEYETYKKAKENPEEIDPMTENSYDFESLHKIYGDKDESDDSGEEKEIWKDPEVQKQVAMDVARSFGAKEVKVNGETINLEDTPSKNEKFSTDYWKSRSVDMYESAPDGWSKLEGATTAPTGYAWYSNNESRFSDEYRHALVKEDKTNNGREKYY